MGRKSLSRDRRKINKKVKAWLNKLLVRLQHEDLDKLKMDDLAKLAGRSKSTIYEYFESKEEILIAVCQVKTESLSRSILDIRIQGLDTNEQYRKLVKNFAEGTEEISISFLQDIKEHFPRACADIERVGARV